MALQYEPESEADYPKFTPSWWITLDALVSKIWSPERYLREEILSLLSIGCFQDINYGLVGTDQDAVERANLWLLRSSKISDLAKSYGKRKGFQRFSVFWSFDAS